MNNYEEVIYDAQAGTRSASLMKDVYWWMALALLVTGGTAWFTASSPELLKFLFMNSGMVFGLCIAELALVWILSASIRSLSFGAALTMFLVYSVLNGLTMSALLLVYTLESVAGTFFITAGMFAAMAFYGTVTQRDLSGVGRFLLMALIGIIIASVVNLFLGSSQVYWMITYAGVVLFAGLTAYDTQKIRNILADADENDPMVQKFVLMGALSLYLDFVNLFLYLIRIFGSRRN